MSHDFKTYDEQIQILKSRNLSISNPNKAKEFLQYNNYYNVVNGYKELFLKNKGARSEDDVYKDGCDFEELAYLFMLDRDLRLLLLRYLIIFENNLKSIYAYEFSKKYTEDESYLHSSNYSTENLNQVEEQITKMEERIEKKKYHEKPIKHYVENDEKVPLWILVNYLTLGEISWNFKILKYEDQETISKIFARKFRNEYNEEGITISLMPRHLKNIIKAANLFRNKCAHDERLYNESVKDVYIGCIYNYFSLPTSNRDNLFMMVTFLKCVLNKTDFNKMTQQLNDLYKSYKDKFHTISIEEIKKKSGFEKGNLFGI